MTLETWAIIVTVTLFGITNLIAIGYWTGSISARIEKLETWADEVGPKIVDTGERVSKLEGILQEK